MLLHVPDMSRSPPENNADAPAPATARPTMSITEFLAAAQIIDPNSNRHRANKYVYLTLKYVYIRPNEGCNAVVVSR